MTYHLLQDRFVLSDTQIALAPDSMHYAQDLSWARVKDNAAKEQLRIDPNSVRQYWVVETVARAHPIDDLQLELNFDEESPE